MHQCVQAHMCTSSICLPPSAQEKVEFDGENVHTHCKAGLLSTDLHHPVLYYITTVELLYDSFNHNSCLVQRN